MSFHEVILFVSTSSSHSRECYNIIKQKGLQVKLVRLDSEESRQRAMAGKYFQIAIVPTLVVIYDDGRLQLFSGKEKILNWINMITTPPVEEEPEYIEKEPKREPKKKGLKKKEPKKGKKQKKVIEEDEPEEMIIQYDEPPPPSSKKSSKMTSVFAMAKQMEQDMKKTYGYREEDLPRF